MNMKSLDLPGTSQGSPRSSLYSNGTSKGSQRSSLYSQEPGQESQRSSLYSEGTSQESSDQSPAGSLLDDDSNSESGDSDCENTCNTNNCVSDLERNVNEQQGEASEIWFNPKFQKRSSPNCTTGPFRK